MWVENLGSIYNKDCYMFYSSTYDIANKYIFEFSDSRIYESSYSYTSNGFSVRSSLIYFLSNKNRCATPYVFFRMKFDKSVQRTVFLCVAEQHNRCNAPYIFLRMKSDKSAHRAVFLIYKFTYQNYAFN